MANQQLSGGGNLPPGYIHLVTLEACTEENTRLAGRGAALQLIKPCSVRHAGTGQAARIPYGRSLSPPAVLPKCDTWLVSILEFGPKVGSEKIWHEGLWDDDWFVDLTTAGNTATLIYVHTPGATPYEVRFEGVTHLAQPQRGLIELGGSGAKKGFAAASDLDGNKVFEIEYSAAYAQEYEWISVDGRLFSQAEAKKDEQKGSWIVFGIYLVVGALVLLWIWLRSAT